MKNQTIIKADAQKQRQERLEREAKALRANLLRRKQQKRLRPTEEEQARLSLKDSLS
ncbi:hypothetical protein [Aristophania vespae]|uniref:hypothetical protein n=1 Tax=Aristophania vespae TaxID=2697033 RepID=UPI00191BE7CF|nr:hypothetical protein [Aristophania vespae]UMM63763.1 hypothetical protein DM15PD_07390 [Aristophania vespae]